MMGFFAATATRTNAGIAARQRAVIQDNVESKEALLRKRLAKQAHQDRLAREAAANERIAAWMKEAQSGKPSPRRIIQGIARQHGFTVEDIIGHCQAKAVIVARFHAVWEVKREYPTMSLSWMGRQFGNRDHASLLNSLRRWPKMASRLNIPCKSLESAT